MTDLAFPLSAQRFASYLDREYCVWMPSPSLALLSALVTGRGRPKRLLVTDGAPSFISKIGLVTGAAPLIVEPNSIDDVLRGLLKDEALSPDLVWGIATHRDGKLSPTDWLSRCAALGVPTIELCLGSLNALAHWGSSPALFTVVDLDAEAAFLGARVTALLTGDRVRAGRVQKLCLPEPGAQDYVFDAGPRGLDHDEAALLTLVERATSQSPRSREKGAGDSSPGWKGPATALDDRWRALQAELDEHRAASEEWQRRFHAEEAQGASRLERERALLLEARKTLDERQKAIDRWEERFREAESEAEKDAASVHGARRDLARQKDEFDRALVAVRAETEALAEKLRRAERERDLAVLDAARRDESERQLRGELKRHMEQSEAAAAAMKDREVKQAEAAHKSRAGLAAEVARLEKEVAALGESRADLLKQKQEAEQALVSLRAERQGLTSKLKDLDAELGEALAEAAKRATEQRSVLDARDQRVASLEKELAILTAREAAQVREGDASRTEAKGRIAELEAALEAAHQKLSVVEGGRERALREGASREEALRSQIAEQTNRADRLESEAAALRNAATQTARGVAAHQSALEERDQRVSQLEKAIATLAAREAANVRERDSAKAEVSSRIAALETERTGLLKKASIAEDDRARVQTEAARNAEALRSEVVEHKSRAERLDAEARSLKSAAAEAGLREEALHAEIAEGKARAERAEAEVAILKRAALEAGQREETQRLELADHKSRAERLELEMAALKRAAVEASQVEKELRAENSEYKSRVERLEGEAPAAGEREARLTEEWEKAKAGLSEKIRRLEAAAATAQKALAELLGEKAAVEGALGQARAEARLAGERMSELERAHAADRGDAAKRQESLRAALDQAMTQKEAATRELWGLQSELDGLRAAAAAAEQARADAASRNADVERALASRDAENDALLARLTEFEEKPEPEKALPLLAEPDEAEARAQLVEGLRSELAAVSQQARKQAEAWEAERGDLVARIARLEAAALTAERARTELLNRKKESDRSLAEADVERGVLLKKLATAENERDEARALVAARLASAPTLAPARVAPPTPGPTQPAPASPAAAPAAGGGLNTGGLSALVNLWNTAVIKRPAARSATVELPPELVNEILVTEAMKGENKAAEAAKSPAPTPAEPVAAAVSNPSASAPVGNSGGLSALVNLWTTAKTLRPFRKKAAEEASSEAPGKPVFGIEEIKGEGAPVSPRSPDAAFSAAIPPKAARPASPATARPAPTRRPPPKPVPPPPAPDGTEELGGWLRGLASKMRSKK